MRGCGRAQFVTAQGREIITLAYGLFGAAAVAAFAFLRVRTAIILVFLGGWIVLPFGRFAVNMPGQFPWWTPGLAIPADNLVSKAWIAPVVALCCATAFDGARWRALRPVPADLPMALWCVTPLLTEAMVGTAHPGAARASAYLAGTWGATWLIGRIWFSGASGHRTVLMGLALAGCACLPIAFLETPGGPFLHEWVYGPHPFWNDGIVRYIGYRPLGFFEHGNQYGIWVALCAVSAIGWVWTSRHRSQVPKWPALIASALAVASQSVGAILLGMASIFGIRFWSKRIVRYAALFAVGSVAAVGAVQFSGIIPVERFVRQTAAGQKTLDVIRSTGRGSIAWRVSQDLKTLDGIRANPVFGNGTWDWWRPYQTRPWGLMMLIAGQYGLIGLALALGGLLIAAGRVLTNRPYPERPTPEIVLAFIVFAALGDAVLNSFFFFPAILAAGAIAARVPVSNNAEVHDERP